LKSLVIRCSADLESGKVAASAAKREEALVKPRRNGGVPIEVIVVALAAVGCLAAMSLRLTG
jgi:hypothetical protein